MKWYDACFYSSGGESLASLLRLKQMGYRVAWIKNPDLNQIAFSQAHFSGIFPHYLDSFEYRLLTQFYHALDNQNGYCIMEEGGPVECGNPEFIKHWQSVFGGEKKFKEKMGAYFDFLNQSQVALNNWKTVQKTEWGPWESFSFLYPKSTPLDWLFEAEGIDQIESLSGIEKKQGHWVSPHFRSHALVVGPRVPGFLSSEIKKHPKPLLVWCRFKVNAQDLWKSHPTLPPWTFWVSDKAPLSFYDDLFIFQKVVDDGAQADCYFKLPYYFAQNYKQRTDVAELILNQLNYRLHVKHLTRLHDVEILPQMVWAQTPQLSSQWPGLFWNHPYFWGGLSLNHQFFYERKLTQSLVQFLKKIDNKKEAE